MITAYSSGSYSYYFVVVRIDFDSHLNFAAVAPCCNVSEKRILKTRFCWVIYRCCESLDVSHEVENQIYLHLLSFKYLLQSPVTYMGTIPV